MKNLIMAILSFLLCQINVSCKTIKEVPDFEVEPYVKDDIIVCYFKTKGWHPQGGDRGYIKHLKENLKYPELALKDSIQGTVYVRFWIEKDGSIPRDSIKVVKSVHYLLDAEAVRLVSIFPNWEYNYNDDTTGIPKAGRKRVPVKFKISK